MAEATAAVFIVNYDDRFSRRDPQRASCSSTFSHAPSSRTRRNNRPRSCVPCTSAAVSAAAVVVIAGSLGGVSALYSQDFEEARNIMRETCCPLTCEPRRARAAPFPIYIRIETKFSLRDTDYWRIYMLKSEVDRGDMDIRGFGARLNQNLATILSPQLCTRARAHTRPVLL